MEERVKLWDQVISELYKVGKHLNTVGNADLEEIDYYKMNAIETILEGYRKQYKGEE